MITATAEGPSRTFGATIPSDTPYEYQNSNGQFSTGFNPTFSGDANGELDFAGTNYAVIDDLTSASINNLTFSNSGLVTITPSNSANVLTLTTSASSVGPSITVNGNGSATIGVVLGGTDGMTKNGTGTLTLIAANAYTGTTTLGLGSLVLDFTATGAPTNEIINAASALAISGGTLTVNGASTANSQTFASTTFNANSSSTINATGGATLNLGALTYNFGATVVLNGPATVNSPTTTAGDGATVGPTGTITTTSGTADAVLTSSNAGGTKGAAVADFATVGLYDFAAVSGSSPFTIIGLSQATGGSAGDGGYTIQNGGSAPASGSIDVIGNINSNSNTSNYTAVRFNAPGASNFNIRSVTSTGGVLVTPNVGAFNITIGGTSQFAPGLRSSSNAGSMVLWQNNTNGFLSFTSPISDGKTAGGTIVQAGLGTVVYFANTYTGQTALNGGISEISSDAGLGAPATAAQVTLSGGTIVGTANFSLDNAGANPRPVPLGAAGGGLAALDGTLMNVTGVVSGGGPLNIGFGQILGTGAGTANATAQFGGGQVVLSGANAYTGATNVNFGSLLMGNTGSIASTAPVTVLNGATLGTHYTGTAGSASIAGPIADSGAISMIDGTTGTLNLNGGLTLNSGASLDLELGAAGSPGASDVINLGTSGLLNVAAQTPINLESISGFGSGTYTLLTFGSGDATNLSNFTLGTHPTGFQFTLGSTATTEYLTVAGNAVPPIAYWTGAQDANWNTVNGMKTNWSTDAAGTQDAGQVPGSVTDVKFIASNGQNLNTTLGMDFTIKGLEFNAAATSSVTIGGANTLTVGADGLLVDSGSGAHTINLTGDGTNSGIVVGASQTWANNSASPFTVASGISGTAGAGQTTTLTFNGSGTGGMALNGVIADGTGGGNLALLVNKSGGTLVLDAANTFTGGLTIAQGIVQAASGAPANVFGAGLITMADNTTLDLNGVSPTIALLATSGTGAGANVTSTSGTTLTLTLNGTGTATFAGAIGNGAATTLNVIKTGSGVQNLAGVNTYTGTTQVNGGQYVLVAGGVLGTSTTPAAAVNINGGIFGVAGGSFYSNAATSLTGNGIAVSGGSATFNGGIHTANSDGAFISVTGGTLNVSDLNLNRTAANTGTLPLTASTTSGVYVNPPAASTATVNLGTLEIGTGNSSASFRMDGGTVNVSGAIVVGDNANAPARYNILQVNGGTFTSSDATDGIILSEQNGTYGSLSELYLSGGTTSAQRISFGLNATDTTASTGAMYLGTSTTPATLYLGAGGIVQTQQTGYTSSVTLTNGTIGALADWSTTVPATIDTAVTFQAADATNVPHDITLGGVLSGSGTLTKTGGGTLAITANNTYTGGTAINAGTVLANSLDTSGSPTGSLGTGPVNINTGGTLGGGAAGASGGLHVAAPIIVNAGTAGGGVPGGTISAGTPTTSAVLLTAGQTWNGSAAKDGTGGTYLWKLNLASPTAGSSVTTAAGATLYNDKTGTNWDQLTMQSLSVNGYFNVQVVGLNGASIGSAGAFDPSQSYRWVAANVPTSSGGTIDSSGLNGFVLPPPTGFGTTALGVFTASIDPSSDPGFDDVVISYSPAPEPTSLALLGGVAAAALLVRRRRSRRRNSGLELA